MIIYAACKIMKPRRILGMGKVYVSNIRKEPQYITIINIIMTIIDDDDDA